MAEHWNLIPLLKYSPGRVLYYKKKTLLKSVIQNSRTPLVSRGGVRQNQVDSHISEYLWCLDCENHGADPFQELIEDIKTVYPVP